MPGLEVGLAIWGVCFLMALVYLFASLRTFKASPRCTEEAS